MDRWRRSPVSGLEVAALSVAVLYFAKPVFLPLAVAVLLDIVLSPVVRRLERVGIGRLRVGRIGSVLAVTLAMTGAFAGIAWIIGVQGGALVEKLPTYRRAALAQLREPLDSLRRLERTAREVRELAEPPGGGPPPSKVEVVEGRSELVGFAREWAGSVASLLGTAGLVIVLLCFLLVEHEGFRDRLIRIIASRDVRTTTSVFSDAVDRVTGYLRALALVNLGHGCIVAIGLLLIGLPGALLFGLLSATLRFIPYAGPWTAASIPIAVALLSTEGFALALGVALFFVVLELLSNNLFEPLVIGGRIGLSPFAMIVSGVFWAWLWGPVGLVLSAPFTACLVAFGRYAPGLEPLAILLSDADALPPAERLYQRLLARDIHEATALVGERAAARGALSTWDEVVLPVLIRLEQDRQQERLDAEEVEVARQTFELLLSELPESAAEEGPSSTALLCLPARGGWDDVVCRALARFLSARGVPASAMAHRPVAEAAVQVERAAPPRVLISCLAGPAQHLLIGIRKRCPETGIVVGLWRQEAASSLRARTASVAGTHPVNQFADAIECMAGSTPR